MDTTAEQGAIIALGKVHQRLVDLQPRMSWGYHESGAKKDGLIRWQLCDPDDWSEVILKGPQIGVGTPFFKQPPDTGTKGRPQDLTRLPIDALPRSEYVRAVDVETYRRQQDKWPDYREQGRLRPYTEFYRLIWRRMIADNTDRSLFAAIYPPGAAHVHTVLSLAMKDNRSTVLTAGFWAAIPLDYLQRITGVADLQNANSMRLPAPSPGHPLASPLLLRVSA